MIDWDTSLLAPVMGVFGQPIVYTPAGGVALALTDAVFIEAYVDVEALDAPGVNSTHPVLGIRLSEFPAGFSAGNAQGDKFTVTATGLTYIVKSGQPDGHGHARLDCNLYAP